jgi:hypothetical protein
VLTGMTIGYFPSAKIFLDFWHTISVWLDAT